MPIFCDECTREVSRTDDSAFTEAGGVICAECRASNRVNEFVEQYIKDCGYTIEDQQDGSTFVDIITDVLLMAHRFARKHNVQIDFEGLTKTALMHLSAEAT